MRVLSTLLLLSLCLSCGKAFVFFSPREKAKEPLEKVPCGAHTRVRPTLPAQGWLRNKWLWLFFVVVLYVILKFRVHSEKSKTKEQNPLGLRGYPLRSSPKKNQHGSPTEDYALTSLTHLEKDLVQFLSKVRCLKAAVRTGSNLRLYGPSFPADPQSCVTMYEVWGENPK
ncbi:protein FAM209B [Fukomys damarensis]|uniref:Protein FAM209B n=1 Tax=Fukomys damarensis TaxID=885580 RepID=A0A091DM46_FUKDA|nr:protein FAM209B [Fukomys damarensis]KFO31345.1 hypothetical protein H920_07275 [Fukomys damarensis]